MTIPRKLSENFVETEVDGEVLIVDLDGGELFSLKDTGRAVWGLIDGKRDIAAIASALSPEYEAAPGELERDCKRLIDELAVAGLIEQEPPLP